MDKFEKFLMLLGGIALIVAFGFPQVMGGFFILIVIIIVANCIIEKIDEIKIRRDKAKE